MYRRGKQARLLTNGIIGVSTDTTLGDEHWNDVTLLLDGEDATIADVSSASTALTVGSSVSQNTSVFKHGSGSLRFTHTTASNANTYVSYTGPTLSGDYSVEFWWRPDALPTADGTDEMLWECRAGATTYPLLFYTGYLVGSPQIQLYAEGAARIQSTTTLATNTWFHVALVRSSGTYTMYIDGVSQGTWANSTTINSTTHYIGRRYAIHSSNYYGLNGYLDDFRLTPGVARYTQNFKPPVKSFPAQPLGLTVPVAGDDFWDDVSLLIRGDTLTDLSDNAHTVSENGSTPLYNDTTTTKYASGSLTFDGASDYITVPDDPSLELGSGDFTIECWAYHSGALSTKSTIMGKRSNYSDYTPYLINADTTNPDKKMRFLASAGSNWDIIITDTDTFPYDQWVHVAVTRAGNAFTLWINGQSKVTTTAAITLMDNSAPLYIGRGSANTGADLHDWNGNIEDFRITKGVARYTSNFTPPTASFLTNAPSTTTTGRRGVGTYDSISPSITNSAYFGATSDYMTFTPASAGNRLKWTLSFWVKKATKNARVFVWGAGTTTSELSYIQLGQNDNDNSLLFLWRDGSTTSRKLETTAAFPTGVWTHVVMAFDAANATTADKIKFYIDGSLITSFSSDARSTLSGSSSPPMNAADRHAIGVYAYNLNKPGTSSAVDLADFHFIDGQVLSADDFGEDVSGTWSAKAYTGTYGSNGYHLDFTDGNNLGTDNSGNGNNWTEVSLTAADNQDAITTSDIPQVIREAGTLRTRGYIGAAPTALAVDTFATLDPTYTSGDTTTLSEGNLKSVAPASGGVNCYRRSTTAYSSNDKVYFELRLNTTDGSYQGVGVGWDENTDTSGVCFLYYSGGSLTRYGPTGTNQQTGLSGLSAGAIIGVAANIGAGTVQFYVDGSTFGNEVTGATLTNVSKASIFQIFSGSATLNFGQDATFNGTESAGTYTDANGLGEFQYEPPAGFVGLYTTTRGNGMLTLYDRYVDALA